MEPLADRLLCFLQYKQMTASAFSRCLRYNSCEKIARLFRINGAKPSVDILRDIAEHFGELNMRWLLTGDGNMLTPERTVAETAEWTMAEAVR